MASFILDIGLDCEATATEESGSDGLILFSLARLFFFSPLASLASEMEDDDDGAIAVRPVYLPVAFDVFDLRSRADRLQAPRMCGRFAGTACGLEVDLARRSPYATEVTAGAGETSSMFIVAIRLTARQGSFPEKGNVTFKEGTFPVTFPQTENSRQYFTLTFLRATDFAEEDTH